jgi:ribose transport system permease protein
MTAAPESAVTPADGVLAAERAPRYQVRFMAIWLAFLALLALSGIIAPRSLLPSTFLAILPLAAFLTITAAGEALVLMSRNIDLSIPAVISLASTILLGWSRGREEDMVLAIVAALAFAVAVGLVNGFLVALLKLNSLIVTLAVGAIVSGMTLWYRESLPAESRVPEALADLGGARFLGLNTSAWVAIVLVVVLTVILRKTTVGRRFSAVGANPRAAWIAGINVSAYQIGAFAVAALLYGIAGILLSAFIRNPTLGVGEPYLLAPIAAAVLGGTAITGGVGSVWRTLIGALIISVVRIGMTFVGVDIFAQQIVFGGVLILAVAATIDRSKIPIVK